jgi:hypothetical protein
MAGAFGNSGRATNPSAMNTISEMIAHGYQAVAENSRRRGPDRAPWAPRRWNDGSVLDCSP